jgi:hypothetical protein
LWQILLQKSFWGDERNFLEPLMRFTSGNVRDHIVSHKNDHGASYRRYAAFQWRSRLKIGFCEIFGIAQFSTFATLSANRRHVAPVSWPVKVAPMLACGLRTLSLEGLNATHGF